MMISVVFDASDESVLDMDNLIGLVGYTAFVGYHHDCLLYTSDAADDTVPV